MPYADAFLCMSILCSIIKEYRTLDKNIIAAKAVTMLNTFFHQIFLVEIVANEKSD